MQAIYLVFLEVHVASATLGLVAFWLAMMSRKGGVRHRQAGLTFVASMGFAAVLALVMAVAVVIEPGIREGAIRGLFVTLGVFAVGTLALLTSGVRAVRQRRTRPEGWMVRHLVGVLGASVIGHTALVVSLVPVFLPDVYGRDPTVNALPWVLPPLIGIGLIVFACRHYGPRFESRSGGPHGHGAGAPVH